MNIFFQIHKRFLDLWTFSKSMNIFKSMNFSNTWTFFQFLEHFPNSQTIFKFMNYFWLLRIHKSFFKFMNYFIIPWPNFIPPFSKFEKVDRFLESKTTTKWRERKKRTLECGLVGERAPLLRHPMHALMHERRPLGNTQTCTLQPAQHRLWTDY